jgi:hypothetical protein
VLTSGLHARHAARFADAFGCLIRASPQALERLDGGLDAELYTHGEDVAPGITAIHIDAIAPDQYALHIAVDDRAIALADALNTYGGGLAFFSDDLLGADPENVKGGLRDALRGLLTRDFDHLLFAHGEPLIGGGRAALRRFLREAVALRKRAVAQASEAHPTNHMSQTRTWARSAQSSTASLGTITSSSTSPTTTTRRRLRGLGALGGCACRQQQSTAMARPHASRTSASASSPAAPSRPPSARPR